MATVGVKGLVVF